MPTPTFWSSDEKLPVSQTKVSIPSDNGLNYQAGQRIIFTIPDNIEYFNPVNTLLECDFKLSMPVGGEALADVADTASTAGWAQTRLMLDAELGGNVLIRHIRLYGNSAEMPLLEEIQDCNILAAVKYDYNSNSSDKKKRALTEGCSMYSQKQRGDLGLDQSPYNNTENNTYFDHNDGDDNNLNRKFAAAGSSSGFKTAKLLLPLHQSGIFGSSVVFPNKLVSGLRIELELCETAFAVRQLDTVQLNTRLEANPIFHSITGGDVPDATVGSETNWLAADTNVSDTFYVARENSNDTIEKFPFCIGERFSMKRNKQSIIDDFIVWKNANGDEIYPRIKKIELAPAVAGQTFPLVKITLDTAVYPDSVIDAACSAVGKLNLGNPVFLYSTSLTGGAGTLPSCAAFNPTYVLSNAKLLVERVEMPQGYTSKMMSAMSQGGTLNYDFLSFTNYKYSQGVSDRVANIRVPVSNKRCKGVICCPVDASVYSNMERINCGNLRELKTAATVTYETEREGSIGSGGVAGDHANHSKRSGLVGIADGITRYQFFYSGKLNPSRPVVCSKISNRKSIAQQPLVETEKCLAVCQIPPTSFQSFRTNFVVARGVSLQNGVADLSTTDFNIQIEYQEQDNAPLKPKLWNIYIGHLRRLMIKGDSVRVEV